MPDRNPHPWKPTKGAAPTAPTCRTGRTRPPLQLPPRTRSRLRERCEGPFFFGRTPTADSSVKPGPRNDTVFIFSGARKQVYLPLRSGRDVPLRQLGALAEEKLLQLLFHDLLRLRVEGIQAVLVHQHLGIFDPHLPRLGRDVLIDSLADLAFPRHALEPGHVFPELHAVHHALAGLGRRGSRGIRGSARIVRHLLPPRGSEPFTS